MNSIEFKYIASANLPTKHGAFCIHGFEHVDTKQEHIALSYGEWTEDQTVSVRIHSECLTGDAFFSEKCDCGDQLDYAMRFIVKQGSGVILYLRQEGRGIGLINKIKAYNLQDKGFDTVDANTKLGFLPDERKYDVCKVMLDTLNIKKINLLTNNPDKLNQLKDIGIRVESRIPVLVDSCQYNVDYLRVKKERMSHILD